MKCRVLRVGIYCRGEQLGFGVLGLRGEGVEEGRELGGFVCAGEVEDLVYRVFVQAYGRHCACAVRRVYKRRLLSENF